MKDPLKKKSVEELQEELDFFSLSAHEIAASLTALKWSLNLLLDEDIGDLNDKQKELLRTITKENNRGITLLHQTLAFIREGAGHIQYEQLPFNMSVLVQETIDMFTHEAGHQGMHFIFHHPSSPCITKGDRSKIAIVLHNLIKNAIKYGYPNTDIVITLSCTDAVIVFSITDTGPVIAPSEIKNLFDKFFRAKSTSESVAGFGLGLYASKKIVEKHGGSIFCESTEQGTLFSVTLPLVV